MQAHGNLGHLYLHGLGVGKDVDKAREHFEAGAAHGEAASLNGLGYMYLHGIGVEMDIVKGADMIKRAADAGYVEAMYNLALLRLKAGKLCL